MKRFGYVHAVQNLLEFIHTIFLGYGLVRCSIFIKQYSFECKTDGLNHIDVTGYAKNRIANNIYSRLQQKLCHFLLVN